MDKNLFLKNMEEMIQIAKTNGNQIDHKELLDYFSDYELNEEAKKLLIASFVEAGIRVLGVDEAQIVAEEEAKEKADISEEEQGAIRFYEEELEQMDLPGEEEQKELIHAWLVEKGDGEAVIESFLPQILEIARTHTGKVFYSEISYRKVILAFWKQWQFIREKTQKDSLHMRRVQ